MSLPADIAAALASGDKEAARRLAGVIAGQMARGECHGFEGDLAALRKLAGTDQPLGKLAKCARKGTPDGKDAVLAPDLQARLEVALKAHDRAANDFEKSVAQSQLRTIRDDIITRQGFMKAFAEPQRMELLR